MRPDFSVRDIRQLDPDTLDGLLDLTDDEGVISCYAGFDVHSATGGAHKDHLRLELKAQLEGLTAWLREHEPDRAQQAGKLIEQAQPHLEDFTHGVRSGCGTILVLRLASWDIIRLDVPWALPVRTYWSRTMILRPLLEIRNQQRPLTALVVENATTQPPEGSCWVYTPTLGAKICDSDGQLTVELIRHLQQEQPGDLAVYVPPSELQQWVRQFDVPPETVHETRLDSDDTASLTEHLAAEHDRLGLQRQETALTRLAEANGHSARGAEDVRAMLLEGRVDTVLYRRSQRLRLQDPEWLDEAVDGYHGIEQLIRLALSTRASVICLDDDQSPQDMDVAAILRW